MSNNEITTEQKTKLILIFSFVILLFVIVKSPDLTNPRKPNELECVIHNNLCIATTDVIYDYTSVKTRTPGYPAYNKEWNNGWEAARLACKEWGGRLPNVEDFATIVDAFNHNKIRLQNYKSYLTNTPINTYRVYAYSHNDNFASHGYTSKTIYDSVTSIPKSGDWIITGNYNTGTAYTWNARCVK